MTDKRSIDHPEQRSGKDRRRDACSSCDIYRRQDEERKRDNEGDHSVMWRAINGKLPRWVFVTFLTAGVLIVGSGFGFFGLELRNQRIEHSETMKEMTVSMGATKDILTGMAVQQAVMMVKVDRLEKTQENSK